MSNTHSDPLQTIAATLSEEVATLHRSNFKAIKRLGLRKVVNLLNPVDVALYGFQSGNNTALINHCVRQFLKNSLETKRGKMVERAVIAISEELFAVKPTHGPDITFIRDQVYFIGEIKSGSGNSLNAGGRSNLAQKLKKWAKPDTLPMKCHSFRTVLLHLNGQPKHIQKHDSHPMDEFRGIESWNFLFGMKGQEYRDGIYRTISTASIPFQGHIEAEIQKKVQVLSEQCQKEGRDLFTEITSGSSPTASAVTSEEAGRILRVRPQDPVIGASLRLSGPVFDMFGDPEMENLSWMGRQEENGQERSLARSTNGTVHDVSGYPLQDIRDT